MNERCSTVLLNKLPSKEKDPGSFTILCDIGQLHIDNALADLGASISLMPYTMYEKLGLGTTEPVKLEREHLYSASANEIDEKKLELKDLPNHSEYAYLHGDKSFPIIISSELSDKEKSSLLQVLEKRKGAIAWKMILLNSNRTRRSRKDDIHLSLWDFAYRRMPFGLCNAPATFQRCMMAIFHDMVEDFMEVFMDDFSVFGYSFDCSLANLDRMLARCEETNLVLNWEKCHFMVKEGIVLGHKISGAGAVLGQIIDGKFKPIYYASKTLNNAQEHYTTTKKELLAVVFSFDKFRPYLVLSKTIVYTDHSALKYLFNKQDAKPRLIRWVLLFQGFDIEIKDKRGAKNLAVDHLSRLENPELSTFTKEEIADEFLDEHRMALKPRSIMTNHVKNYFWDEPYAFKLCPDNIMRRCVAGNEISKILAHCHSGPTGGHHSASIEHKAYWALKQCNVDLTAVAKNHFMELNELMELRDNPYENTQIYKERTKKWHDSRLRGDKDFKVGDLVLLFNSRFKMHPGKLKSRWYGTNVVKTVYPYGTVEITR
ncbi:reverse transcriptase domain-containing protein [Tanacetum coccineum]